MDTYADVNVALWVAWVVYWVAASGSAARGRSLEPVRSRLIHLAAAVVSVALLLLRPLHMVLPGGAVVQAAGCAVTASGPLLACWARRHLGKYWSGRVELKEGHHVIRTGPYAWVRHPIYTGILLGFLGSALVVREVTAPLAVLVMLAAYLRKIRMEEAALEAALGDEYEAYRREVTALVPFVV